MGTRAPRAVRPGGSWCADVRVGFHSSRTTGGPARMRDAPGTSADGRAADPAPARPVEPPSSRSTATIWTRPSPNPFAGPSHPSGTTTMDRISRRRAEPVAGAGSLRGSTSRWGPRGPLIAIFVFTRGVTTRHGDARRPRRWARGAGLRGPPAVQVLRADALGRTGRAEGDAAALRERGKRREEGQWWSPRSALRTALANQQDTGEATAR